MVNRHLVKKLVIACLNYLITWEHKKRICFSEIRHCSSRIELI
jgi:hypothetical protein